MDFIPQFEPEPEPEIEPEIDDTMTPEAEKECIVPEIEDEITTSLTEDDIFTKPPPKVLPLKEPVKKKRTISEAHKLALANAREKALASRKKNAAIRKEEKDLLKKKKEMELDKLREDVNGPKKKIQPLPVEVVKEKFKQVSFDEGQIEEISLNAIMQYDKIRKSRKVEKKEQQKLDDHENRVKQELQRKLQPTNQLNNYWDNCY